MGQKADMRADEVRKVSNVNPKFVWSGQVFGVKYSPSYLLTFKSSNIRNTKFKIQSSKLKK